MPQLDFSIILTDFFIVLLFFVFFYLFFNFFFLRRIFSLFYTRNCLVAILDAKKNYFRANNFSSSLYLQQNLLKLVKFIRLLKR